MIGLALAGNVLVYIVDTSTWWDLVPFRPSTFVGVWDLIEGLASDGRLLVPEEVDRELNSGRYPDKWVHDRPHIHRSTVSLWDRACEVADRYPQLVDLAKPKGTADPFVVACAIEEIDIRSGTIFPCEAIVVTSEVSHLPGRAAIPDGCAGYGIRSVDLYGWFALEGRTF